MTTYTSAHIRRAAAHRSLSVSFACCLICLIRCASAARNCPATDTLAAADAFVRACRGSGLARKRPGSRRLLVPGLDSARQSDLPGFAVKTDCPATHTRAPQAQPRPKSPPGARARRRRWCSRPPTMASRLSPAASASGGWDSTTSTTRRPKPCASALWFAWRTAPVKQRAAEPSWPWPTSSARAQPASNPHSWACSRACSPLISNRAFVAMSAGHHARRAVSTGSSPSSWPIEPVPCKPRTTGGACRKSSGSTSNPYAAGAKPPQGVAPTCTATGAGQARQRRAGQQVGPAHEATSVTR